MLHNKNEDYIASVNNYVSGFNDNSFRKLAGKDFKSWPDPLEETWRLSRLGTLARKKIEPIKINFDKSVKSNLNTIGSNIIKFFDGAYREDISSKLPIGVSLKELNETESLSYLSKIKNTNLKNHPSTNASLSCTPSIIKSGGPELALEVEKNGYSGMINAA